MAQESFSAWLAGLGPEELAGLLAARPDATAEPLPATLGELAQRLSLPHGVFGALAGASLPQLQLLEVLAALGDGSARAQVRGLLDEATEDDFAAVLTGLLRRGLVWPERDDRLRLAGPLRDWPLQDGPLGLGPSAAVLLPRLTAEALRRIARELGVSATGKRKDNLVESVLAALRDGDLVRQVAEAASPAVRKQLTAAARTGINPDYDHIVVLPTARSNDPLAWAVARGLLIQLDWHAPVMPAEVGMALRGANYRAPFSPAEPVPATMTVPEGAVEAEFSATTTRVVQETTSLLRACAERPPGRRKTGGVGVRELRRVAKAVGCTEEGARLWLELTGAAGLVEFDGAELVPSGAFDDWQRAEPAERLASLLRTWQQLPRLPLLTDPDTGRAAPLDHRAHDPVAPRLRVAVLQALAALPAGRGVRGPDAVTAAVLWQRALMFEDPEMALPYVAAVWQEAELLGVLAHGTLTPAGRALAAPDTQDDPTAPVDGYGRTVRAATQCLEDVVADVLTAECTTALLQADLTAVVPGPPSARLADLLDQTADRESHETASVWRFSPASIRRALDQGSTAAELLTELRAAAATDLPQPLEYLINDVARRHGEVVVTPLASAICCATPGLLGEIRANRRLRSLSLRELAPTVLASTKPVSETLTALRDAGYLPIGQGPNGLPLVERNPWRRTEAAPTKDPTHSPTGRRRHLATPPAQRSPRPGPAELARRLHGTSVDPPPSSAPGDEHLAVLTPQLTAAERRLLSHALDTGAPIRIGYINGDGNRSSRVIEDAALDVPPLISAWCRLRDDERVFHTGRITAIAPAT
ncbi:MAG: helicase-associated domain-containing protein [Actinomadura sp.]